MLKILTRSLCLAVVATCSASLAAAQARRPAVDAKDVLKKVVSTYQAMTSYRDRGVSVRTLKSGGTVIESRIEFETAFKRPGKLRFAWTEKTSFLPGTSRNVVWSDGTSAWSSFAHAKNVPRKEEDLSRAVAGATGISAGTAHTIPRLLSSDVRGFRIDNLERCEVTGTESVGGADCVILSGYYVTGTRCTLWVGRDDNLIRKIVETSDGSEQIETREAIVVNGDVADSTFAE